jgi:hypothetical protein
MWRARMTDRQLSKPKACVVCVRIDVAGSMMEVLLVEEVEIEVATPGDARRARAA